MYSYLISHVNLRKSICFTALTSHNKGWPLSVSQTLIWSGLSPLGVLNKEKRTSALQLVSLSCEIPLVFFF